MAKIQSGRKIICHIKPHDRTYAFIQSLKESNVYIIKLSKDKSGTSFTLFERDLSIVRRIRKQHRIPIQFTRPDTNSIIQFQWMTLLGLFGFIILPYIFSLFLWQISIDDVSDERQVKLMSELQALKVEETKKMSNLVTDSEIRQVLLAKNHDLSWIHIKRTGTKMHITSVPAPVIVREPNDQKVPSDLVAFRKGVITNYDLISGERLVPLNETVKKGDVLVTGVLKQGEKDIVVGAQGQVFADYWLETSFQLPTKIVYDKYSSEQVEFFQVSPAWKTFQKKQSVDNFVDLVKSAFRIERKTIIGKSEFIVNEQWINEAFLPMLRMRTAATLTPKGKIKDEKVLHVTWTNDTVKGKVLYYMNDNIASKRPIHQGD